VHNRRKPLKINNLAFRVRGSKIVDVSEITNKINDLQISLRGSKVVGTWVKSRSLRGSKVVGLFFSQWDCLELSTLARVKSRKTTLLRGSKILCIGLHRNHALSPQKRPNRRGSKVVAPVSEGLDLPKHPETTPERLSQPKTGW
jgi:hypothetical protein